MLDLLAAYFSSSLACDWLTATETSLTIGNSIFITALRTLGGGMHHGIYILTSSRGKHFHMLSLATESSPSITSYGLSLATERSHSKTK